MAIYDYLPQFNYIEPNNLKGLQPGFVVAQMEVADTDLLVAAKDGGEKIYFPNGAICAISKDGIVKANGKEKALFIHFSEPLNTIYNSDQFFAVNVNEECPRLVQLIPGDEWMSRDALTLTEDLAARIVELTDTEGWYSVGMPNGEDGHHYMFLG